MVLQLDRRRQQTVFVSKLGRLDLQLQRQVRCGLLKQLLTTLGRQPEDDKFGMLVGLPQPHGIARARLVDDAGTRVNRYLSTQLLLNVIYGALVALNRKSVV